jgi:hypothetical protein
MKFEAQQVLNKRQVKVKLKQSHYKAWIGPGGSKRLMFPDFKTIGA